MPTGIVFITCYKQYIQKIIVKILIIDAVIFVNPLAMFANEFEIVPNITAKNK